MQRKRGFTIIELIITIGITALLVAVALPRYNGFLRQQEFNASAQGLVICLQTAQREAASPTDVGAATNNVRFTGATMEEIGNDLKCTVTYYSADTTAYKLANGIAVPIYSKASTLFTGVSLSTATAESSAGDITVNDTASASMLVSVYFGTLERGIPIVFRACSAGCESLAPPSLQFGSGISLVLNLSNPFSEVTQRVTMEKIGLPIQLSN